MQSKTILRVEDISNALSSLLGFKVHVFFIHLTDMGDVEVEWEMVKE